MSGSCSSAGFPARGRPRFPLALGERAGWPVFRSDIVRKELLGVEPSTRLAAPYAEGIYRPEHTDAAEAGDLDDLDGTSAHRHLELAARAGGLELAPVSMSTSTRSGRNR